MPSFSDTWTKEFEDWVDSGLLMLKIWMQVARGMEYLASMKVSSEVPLVPDEVTRFQDVEIGTLTLKLVKILTLDRLTD